MTSIASRPRSAPLVLDFGFAQRRTLDHSAATDPTALAYLHHHSFSDDQEEDSMLYSDFDAELAAAHNFVPDVGSTSTSTSTSAPASAAPADADVGPVSSDFEFPEIPPALLESAPEYEFSAHTRVNVFSDASLEALSSLGLDQYGMPTEPIPDGGISWYSQSLDVNAPQDQAYYPYAGSSTATASVLEGSQTADLQGANAFSDLYGYRDHQQFQQTAQQRNSEPDATSYQRVASSHGGDFSDTSLQVAAPTVTESPASFYADTTPISEANSAHSSAKRRRTSPLPQQQGQGSPKFSHTNATNSPSGFTGALRQASSSQPHLSNGSGASGQYTADNFSRGLPSRSLPPAPTPGGSSGAGPSGQNAAYMTQPRPHRPFAAPQSLQGAGAGARPSLSEWTSTGPPRSHGPTPASTLGSSMYALQGSAGRSASASNGNAAASFYSQVGGAEGNFSLSGSQGGPLSMTMADLTGMAASGRNGHARRSTTESQSEDEDINAPPPNPKAVALAAAATKGQSGTQAQHDMLQALNETMSSSLEEHGVARCPFPNCTKTFAKNRSYNLKTHLRSHSQLKPFACASCPRAFSRKHDLERHARVHSGDKPYICEVCGRGFPRSDALRRHWRVEKECGDKASEIEAGQPLPSVPPGSSSILAPSKLPGGLSHHKFNGPNPYPSSWPLDDRMGLPPGLGAGMNLPTSHLAGTKRGRDEW